MNDIISNIIIFDGLAITQEEVDFYLKKFKKDFKSTYEELNNLFNYLKSKFKCELNFSIYKDEGYRKTIVFDDFVFRTIVDDNELDIYQKLKAKPSEYLEEVIEIIHLKNINIVLTKRYDIFDKKFITDNNLLEKYIDDITKATIVLEKYGYYHKDVSVDNSVFVKDKDTIRFILVDYNMLSKHSGHTFRNYGDYFNLLGNY